MFSPQINCSKEACPVPAIDLGSKCGQCASLPASGEGAVTHDQLGGFPLHLSCSVKLGHGTPEQFHGATRLQQEIAVRFNQ
jgi:hypothetical protein